MSKFRYESQCSAGILHLRLLGVLDGSSAWEVRHAVEDAQAREVTLDFRGIEEVWDYGAAVLGAGMRALALDRLRVLDPPSEISDWLERFSVPTERLWSAPQLEVQRGRVQV